MKSHGFTDRSMFEPEAPAHPNAPRDPEANERLAVRVIVDRVRPKSILVHAEGDNAQNTTWLPLSLVEIEPGLIEHALRKRGYAIPVIAPRWLLQREGLIGFVLVGQGRLF